MRIAVIGGGISGNLVARLLSPHHEVDLFEAADHIGGHAQTVDVECFGSHYSLDVAFMVFNNRTYPNFSRLLDQLNVYSNDSDMSFSVQCERTGLEYQGSSLNGLFAQRSNVLRPGFYRMLGDILRFNRHAIQYVSRGTDDLLLGEFLDANRLGRRFRDQYLLPMAAAIWSARPECLCDFPARFILGFFHNHGLLQLRDRPQWKTVRGGSRVYVDALLQPIRDRVRLGCPVDRVARHPNHVTVFPKHRPPETYDHVVLATHADQTLEMLADASQRERDVLACFPYQENEAILHVDGSHLPRHRRAWASWNYHIPRNHHRMVSVTYDLNRLQRLGAPRPICLTLNPSRSVRGQDVIRHFVFHHPLFSLDAIQAQRRFGEISGHRRTHFCGAYWGHGFHEDGVNSALAVAEYFGADLGSLGKSPLPLEPSRQRAAHDGVALAAAV